MASKDAILNPEGHSYLLDPRITHQETTSIVNEVRARMIEDYFDLKTVLYPAWRMVIKLDGGSFSILIVFDHDAPPSLDDIRLDLPLLMGAIAVEEYKLLMKYEL